MRGDGDLPAAIQRVRRRLIPFLFLLYIFAYLDRINVGFAALQMNEALGFSAAVYGLGAGIFFISYTAFEIPSNILLARLGARVWIARIMITWGVVSVGTMFVRSAAAFYLLRFLLGAAEAGFFPGIIYYLTRWVPRAERARTIATFMTATLIAGVIGGPISGALLSMHGALGLAGWQWLFLMEGVPSVMLGAVVLLVLDDRPEDAGWLPAGEKAALVAQLEAEAVGDARDADAIAARLDHREAHTARGALSSGVVWLLAVAHFFLIPVALYGFSFFLPQILQAAFHGTDLQIGLLSSIPYLVGAIAMVIVGRHSDRTGERRRHVAVAAMVCAAGFVAAASVSGLLPSIVVLTVAMAGLASIFGPFWSLATSFVSGVGAAAGIALINSVGNIGGFVGPYVLGYVKDRTQSFGPGLVLIGAVVAIGGLLALMVPDRLSPPRGDRSPGESRRSSETASSAAGGDRT